MPGLDTLPSTTAPSSGTGSIDSEVDFSPSVGTAPLHPVPLSANEGATLDWAGSASEDDRDKRWPLHLPKRRRDKQSAASSRAVVEKQETLYAGMMAFWEIWCVPKYHDRQARPHQEQSYLLDAAQS